MIRMIRGFRDQIFNLSLAVLTDRSTSFRLGGCGRVRFAQKTDDQEDRSHKQMNDVIRHKIHTFCCGRDLERTHLSIPLQASHVHEDRLYEIVRVAVNPNYRQPTPSKNGFRIEAG
jgi:hypothetical protein